MMKHHQKVLVFRLALVLLIIAIAIAISTNLSTSADSEAAGAASYEISDSIIYPVIAVTPQSLSSTRNWERISISVNNPEDYHTINASIKLTIPKGWDYRHGTEETGMYHETNKYIFSIKDFGSYQEKSTNDWFEIRQGSNISSGKYYLYAKWDISYLCRDANITEDANITAISTVQDIIPKRGNRSKNISIELTVEPPDEPPNRSNDQMLTVLVSVISIIVTFILLIFGPGGRQRVKNISRWIRRRR